MNETNNHFGEIFGVPDAGDQIAVIEGVVNGVGDRIVNVVERVFNEVAPRPIGSQKVSPDEERAEYLATIAGSADPVAGSLDWMRQRAGAVGWPAARAEYVEMVRRNEKWLENPK